MTATIERDASPLFNPGDPGMRADPYPYYRRLRETDPVHHSPYGYWVLSRYRDVDAVSRDPRCSSDFPHDANWARHRGGPGCPVVDSAALWMMMQDGVPARRLRSLVGQVFNQRAAERLRPRVAAVIDGLLDGVGEGEIDLVREVALPLPIMVIGELLGIPAADRDQCRAWTDHLVRIIDPIITPELRTAMNEATAEFSAYLAEQVKERRAHPGTDLLSTLVTMDEADDRLTDDEIIANVLLLFNAGHETTINLIGNGMLALLRHPGELARLRRSPGLIDQAIEELARYDSPVQVAARIMTGDIPLGDTVIPAGAKVMMLYGAANRDPERYADPDRLDLGRTGVKSLAFGNGPHFCIGAPLARLELAMLFNALLGRFQSVELLTETPCWRANFNLRGLSELTVRLSR